MSRNHHDLVPLMAPFLDVHMVVPLIDFLAEVKLYEPKVITKTKVKTLGKTNLIDSIEAEYDKFPNDADMVAERAQLQPMWDDRRNNIIDQIDNVPEDVKLVSAFFENAELIEELRSSNTPITFDLLASRGISPQAVESYYRRGKFNYECGMYNDAEQMLGHYISIQQPQSPALLGARWGRLACRILSAKWELALVDLMSVKELIDNRSTIPVDQIRQRAWFLHWSLFVYINQRDGADSLADLFSERVFLQTIENLCPWLLRYYVAFVILSPTRRRNTIKDVLTEIQSMSYLYSDPLTQFLDALLNQFDFEEAQRKLEECQVLMKNDFFLQIFATDFVRESRLLVCETYCSIHHRVSLETLSGQLKMDVEDAERWFVEMVMNTTAGPTGAGSAGSTSSSGGAGQGQVMEARINSETKEALMVTHSKSTHEIVAEKTKDVTARSSVLANNLLSLLQEQAVLMKSRQGEPLM